MSHNIDLNVMNMRTDLAIDEVNNEELEKLKRPKNALRDLYGTISALENKHKEI